MESLIDNRKTNTFPLVLAQVAKWWSKIQGPRLNGERAMLKRCKSPDEVALQSIYYTLLESVLELDDVENFHGVITTRLPLIVGVLAHVEQDTPGCPVAKAMGMKKQGSDRPVMSDLRFRRVLRTEDSSELYISLIRIIKMLGNRADVKDIIQSLYFWNDQTRKVWASQYYLQKDMY